MPTVPPEPAPLAATPDAPPDEDRAAILARRARFRRRALAHLGTLAISASTNAFCACLRYAVPSDVPATTDAPAPADGSDSGTGSDK